MEEYNFKDVSINKLNKTKAMLKKVFNEIYDKIVNLNCERTFYNTVYPIIDISTKYEPHINIAKYVSNFYENKELRDEAVKMNDNLSKFWINCKQRKDVFHAFKEYQIGKYSDEKKNKLTDEEIRYFENTMRDFRRNGLHLDDNKIKDIQKQISEISIKYSDNINNCDISFQYTKKELDGMPESWFTKERCIDSKSSIYKLTIKYPDYVPAIKYVKSESIRKKLYLAFKSRCAKENIPLFEKVIQLRAKLANKLGYSSFTDYATEVQIIKNGENAIDFLTGLNKRFTPLYIQEQKELLQFAKNYDDNKLTKCHLDLWDVGYYSRAYKEKVCDVNMEEVKQYFPLNVVQHGIFNIYETILGLIFKQIPTDNVWHNSVTLYGVYDTKSGELIGKFYLDMHPRTGKFSHAAVFPFVNGCTSHNKKAVVTIACNFPKDECLSFSDVTTFFHEFGHVMHMLCCKTQLSEMNSFSVEGDFVEAPSQMLENWCYSADVLQIMSKHKITGEPLSQKIIDKLILMKNVLQGHNNKWQISYGLFDLKCHSINSDSISSYNIWNDVYKTVFNSNSDSIPEINIAANFGHLLGGYEAGYYGYLLSKTYSLHMYYQMFKGRELDPKMGMLYRKKILEVGATKDGIDIIRDFIGCEPSDKYFLIDMGLN